MRMRVKPWMMALLVVAVVFGTIGVADALGVYAVRGGNGGGSGEGGGGPALPSGALPADIKGSMTLGAVADGFGIPIADLAAAFHLPAGSAAGTKAKDVGGLGLGGDSGFEISVSSVRWFVALYVGKPYEPEESAGLTPEAAAILLAKADLDDAEKALVAARTAGAG
jgi:hypothetical protein